MAILPVHVFSRTRRCLLDGKGGMCMYVRGCVHALACICEYVQQAYVNRRTPYALA